MEPTQQSILDKLDDPEELEALYRKDPNSFRQALDEASAETPDSLTLRIWQARLNYRDPKPGSSKRWMWSAVLIGLAVGVLVRLPAVWLGEEWYYPRMGASLIVLSVAAYFWLAHRDRVQLAIGAALAGAAALFTSFLPDDTDSVIMALLHLPLLFWGLLGAAFAGKRWGESGPRIQFIRYNGELLVLGALVGLGGVVFSLITTLLFEMVIPNSAPWYFENIGVMGAAAIPVAATYLYDVVMKRRTGIPPALARVFAPLFLVMSSVYLVVSLVGGENPFLDRDFLIIFNGLLLVVLAITVFSIAERGDNVRVGWPDYVNVALVAVTLVIDLIALSAIAFRLAEYGFTPNRVVVLGANVVIMIHLALMCQSYLSMIASRGSVADVRRSLTLYLPVYVAWAAVVTFLLPFVFDFA